MTLSLARRAHNRVQSVIVLVKYLETKEVAAALAIYWTLGPCRAQPDSTKPQGAVADFNCRSVGAVADFNCRSVGVGRPV